LVKYATLPLGLAILMASVAVAGACDHYYFVCKPDLTEVFVLLSTELTDAAVPD
jgi:hypothetical protein